MTTSPINLRLQVLEYRVGDSQLSTKHNQLPEPNAGVSLRPDDPFAKKLSSAGVETRNVLIRVTVPKRTGRKRKRGSSDPYTIPDGVDTQSLNVTVPQLLQRLREDDDQYRPEPVGMLRETHRFRTLPDFQLRASEIPMMREVRRHAMFPDYDRAKGFVVDIRPEAPRATLFPAPPSFTGNDITHKYEYQQAAGIIVVTDEHGKTTSRNLTAPRKIVSWGLPPDVAEIPQAPPPDIGRRSVHGDPLKTTVRELKKLLAERPLVTKRVALNALPPISDTVFKEATQWVGYSFKAGPWRDSLIRYGVDPRSDRKYRVYQTLMFQMDKEAFKPPAEASHLQWTRPVRHTRDDPRTHIFDGRAITANGKTWQICDITDPLVAELLATTELREACDVYQWGWYHNGTLAKVRVIMRDKMRFLFAGREPPEDEYRTIAALPDNLRPGHMAVAILPAQTHGERLAALSTEMRNIAKTGEGLRRIKAGERAVAVEEGEENDEADDGDEAVEDVAQAGEVGDDDGDFGDMDAALEAQDEDDAVEGAEDEDEELD